MAVSWGAILHRQIFLPPLPEEDPKFRALGYNPPPSSIQVIDGEGIMQNCLICHEAIEGGQQVIRHWNPQEVNPQQAPYIHPYHQKCLQQWADRPQEFRCPTCRAPLDKNQMPNRITSFTQNFFEEIGKATPSARTFVRFAAFSYAIFKINSIFENTLFSFPESNLLHLFIAAESAAKVAHLILGIGFTVIVESANSAFSRHLRIGSLAKSILLFFSTLFKPMMRESAAYLIFKNGAKLLSLSSFEYSKKWMERNCDLGLEENISFEQIKTSLFSYFMKGALYAFPLLFWIDYPICIIRLSVIFDPKLAHKINDKCSSIGFEGWLFPKRKKIEWRDPETDTLFVEKVFKTEELLIGMKRVVGSLEIVTQNLRDGDAFWEDRERRKTLIEAIQLYQQENAFVLSQRVPLPNFVKLSDENISRVITALRLGVRDDAILQLFERRLRQERIALDFLSL